MQRLSIPPGSREAVRSTMRNILSAIATKNDLDVKAGTTMRGKKALIEDASEEAEIIFRSLEAGIGVYAATILVNEYRNNEKKNPISCSAVQRFTLSSSIINKSKRVHQKSGKDDKGTAWAQARLNQCSEWKERIQLGVDAGNVPNMNFEGNKKPIFLDGIAWFDENHKKVVLGFTSKIEHRISRNPLTGLPCRIEDGGILPEKKNQTSVKFPGEARGMFGAGMRTNIDGTVEGVKTTPFFYTGRFVLGLKEYNIRIEAELERAKQLKGKWGNKGGGYLERYEENWYSELKKEVDKKWCCITDMMEHAIMEATIIFAGTLHADDFLIFHDGLSQWWECDAQQFLESKNFGHRQLRCEGETNKEYKRYHHKVVGDSPELCRALDAHGFADFKASIFYHLSVTSGLALDDPRRFNSGTPKEMESTMARAWLVEPTSARIVEDIKALPRVLDVIIAAEGCVVKDEFLRTGRRSRRADDKGELMRKPRNSQRVSTLKARPLHPDAVHALDILRRGGRDLPVAIVHEIVDEFLDQEDLEDEEDEVEDNEDADGEVE